MPPANQPRQIPTIAGRAEKARLRAKCSAHYGCKRPSLGWQVGVSQIWRHMTVGVTKKVHCRIGRSLRDVRMSAANLSLGIVERIDAKKISLFLVALGHYGNDFVVVVPTVITNPHHAGGKGFLPPTIAHPAPPIHTMGIHGLPCFRRSDDERRCVKRGLRAGKSCLKLPENAKKSRLRTVLWIVQFAKVVICAVVKGQAHGLARNLTGKKCIDYG